MLPGTGRFLRPSYCTDPRGVRPQNSLALLSHDIYAKVTIAVQLLLEHFVPATAWLAYLQGTLTTAIIERYLGRRRMLMEHRFHDIYNNL
jgi:hypothetical protein